MERTWQLSSGHSKNNEMCLKTQGFNVRKEMNVNAIEHTVK